MKILKSFLVFFVLLSFFAFIQNKEITGKINGIALEAPSSPFEKDFFDELLDVNASWVCHIPYAGMAPKGLVISNQESEWKWWGESREGIIASTSMAESKGLISMIKPHLWIRGGAFTGDFNLETNTEWKAWEESYHAYIMKYARLAEYTQAPIFCIGTELKNFVKKRPSFWKKLIQDVRKVYHGKITYAGNWDSYQDFPHWELVDYIGVDAYFPLSDSKIPSVEELSEAWTPWKKELHALSKLHDKPILFTEFGYCSVEYCTQEPWGANHNLEVNNQAQKNAYTAIFNQFWNEDWFAGGFLWKWHVPSHFDASRLQSRFTPQGKDGVEVVRETYRKY